MALDHGVLHVWVLVREQARQDHRLVGDERLFGYTQESEHLGHRAHGLGVAGQRDSLSIDDDTHPRFGLRAAGSRVGGKAEGVKRLEQDLRVLDERSRRTRARGFLVEIQEQQVAAILCVLNGAARPVGGVSTGEQVWRILGLQLLSFRFQSKVFGLRDAQLNSGLKMLLN